MTIRAELRLLRTLTACSVLACAVAGFSACGERPGRNLGEVTSNV